MVSKTTTTNANGKATLTGLNDGDSIPITITKEGFENYTDTLVIDKDNLDVLVALTPVTPSDSQDIIFKYDSSVKRKLYVQSFASSNNNLTIDYGDGTVVENQHGYIDLDHEYESDDVFEIHISGDFSAFGFDDGRWAEYTEDEVTDFPGEGLIGVSIPSDVYMSGKYPFYGCTNLEDYQLYWTENIEEYSPYSLPNNTNAVFTIPEGTTSLYEAAGYPSAKLVERT